MRYDIRLPGYGGVALFLRRTVAGDPASEPAVDIWLLDTDRCRGFLARQTTPEFLPDLARYLFSVASSALPERHVSAFGDATAGITFDVSSSEEQRIKLNVAVVADLEDYMAERAVLDVETSRAAVVLAAERIADLIGGFDLADFGAWV